ncbi:MAG TPA: DUF3037 domain-containing protein [Verrucomicrobiae bacterium]|jgi:hypothetical protein|nr:DUF3037 domain-containing protein [Verrucomicrobiae bacterium]
MKEVACNYAIARFRPYRESGEFVNIGVVLICPQLDYFGHIFEKRKHKRITDFFPELDVNVFKAGLVGLTKELVRITGREEEENSQFVLHEETKAGLARFRELVRPRETLFNFGDVRTVLASSPHSKLLELFQYYIKRQFAQDREYQEIIMRRRLGEFLREYHLAKYYQTDQKIGDDNYHVAFPFVHLSGLQIRKAIKPLNLDKESPTEIYRHGDAWISTMHRLKQINRLPKETLFTIKEPKGNSKKTTAAMEICKELQRFDAVTIPYTENNRILAFAKI